MPPLRLLISGSRDASPSMLGLAERMVERAKARGWSLIVGDAPGIDQTVIAAADRLGVPVEVFGGNNTLRHQSTTGSNTVLDLNYANRDRYMVEQADLVATVWNGTSRGTLGVYNYALELGKRVYEIGRNKVPPELLTGQAKGLRGQQIQSILGTPSEDPSAQARNAYYAADSSDYFPLRQSLAELENWSSDRLPGAVLNHLGERVAGAQLEGFAAVRQRRSDIGKDPAEFFGRRDALERDVRAQALGQPLDLSTLAGMRMGKLPSSPTLGQLYPELNQVRTVRDAQGLLLASLEGGVLERSRQAAVQGQDMDIHQEMQLRVLENIWQYQRSWTPRGATQAVEVSWTTWAASQALAGGKDWTRAERAASAVRGSSLDADTPTDLTGEAIPFETGSESPYVPPPAELTPYLARTMSPATYQRLRDQYGEQVPGAFFAPASMDPASPAARAGFSPGEFVPGLSGADEETIGLLADLAESGQPLPLGYGAAAIGQVTPPARRTALAAFYEDIANKLVDTPYRGLYHATASGSEYISLAGEERGYPSQIYAPATAPYLGRPVYAAGNSLAVSPLSKSPRAGYTRVNLSYEDVMAWGRMVDSGAYTGEHPNIGNFRLLRDEINRVDREIGGWQDTQTEELHGSAIEQFEIYQSSRQRSAIERVDDRTRYNRYWVKKALQERIREEDPSPSGAAREVADLTGLEQAWRLQYEEAKFSPSDPELEGESDFSSERSVNTGSPDADREELNNRYLAAWNAVQTGGDLSARVMNDRENKKLPDLMNENERDLGRRVYPRVKGAERPAAEGGHRTPIPGGQAQAWRAQRLEGNDPLLNPEGRRAARLGAAENTPLSLHAANPAMSDTHKKVYYHTRPSASGYQERVKSNVSYFVNNDYGSRDDFFYILDASAPDTFKDQLWDLTQAAFQGQGLEISGYTQVADPDLDQAYGGAYVKIAGTVSAQASPSVAGNGAASGGNNGGSATAGATPPPRRPRRTPGDPAYPPAPTSEGWTWTQKRGGQTSRRTSAQWRNPQSGQVEYRWYAPNGSSPTGNLEYGIISDETGQVVWDVNPSEYNTYVDQQTRSQAAARAQAPSQQAAQPGHTPPAAQAPRDPHPVMRSGPPAFARFIDTLNRGALYPEYEAALQQNGGNPSVGDYYNYLRGLWSTLGAAGNHPDAIQSILTQIPGVRQNPQLLSQLTEIVTREKGAVGTWSGHGIQLHSEAVVQSGGNLRFDRDNLNYLSQRAVGSMQVSDLQLYNSPLYGQVVSTEDLNSPYGDRRRYSLERGNVAFLNDAQLRRAHGIATESLGESTRGPLPTDVEDAMATVESRIYKAVSDRVKGATEDLKQSGMKPAVAEAIGQAMDDVAISMANAGKDSLLRGMQDEARVNGVTADLSKAHEIKSNAVRLRTAEQIEQASQQFPVIAQKLGALGLTPEQAAALPREQAITLGGDGAAWEIGGGGDGGGWGNARLKGGRLLYGMFVAKRMWDMGVRPELQMATQYGNFASQLAPLAGYGNPAYSLITSGEGGFAARQNLMQEYYGRTSFQEWGGFLNASYALTGSGDSFGRLASVGRVAGSAVGLGLAADIIMPGAAAGLLGISGGMAGVLAGGALLAGGGIMEAINAFRGPDQAPVSYGSLVQGATNAYIRARAFDRYLKSTRQNIAPGSAEYFRLRESLSDEALQEYMTPEERISTQTTTQDQELEKVQGSARSLMKVTGESMEEAARSVTGMVKAFGPVDNRFVTTFGRQAVAAGRTSAQFITEAGGFAESFGAAPGTATYQQYAMQYASAQDETARSTLQFEAAGRSRLGSMIQSSMPTTSAFYGLGAKSVSSYGLTTQAQAVTAGGLIGVASQYLTGGQTLTEQDYAQLTALGKVVSPAEAEVISGVGNLLGQNGAGAGVAFGEMLLGSVNWDASKLDVRQAAIQGNTRALSYYSWRDNTNLQNRWFDGAGRPIQHSSGVDYWKTVLLNSGNTFFQSQALAGLNLSSPSAFARSLYGEGAPQGMLDAFTQNGEIGVSQWINEQQYQSQTAGIGVAAAGVNLSRAYYWGSGSWDHPAAGSAWGLEDQMRALQDTSQRADFSQQQAQLEMNQRYAVAQQSLSLQRMDVSQGYNAWTLGFQQMQSLQGRSWTQQDWQYQDQVRSLKDGWQMEDLDEAIRYASGRQRRDLIRQKERLGLTQSLEGEQIDTQRERQRELWAQEDERFSKQKSYTLELATLDRQQFELNKSQREESFQMEADQLTRRMKEYEAQKKTQDEMTELSRKYQKDQLDLQMASLGVQAEQARKQKEINDALAKGEKNMETIGGVFNHINQYDNASRLMNTLQSLFSTVNAMDQPILNSANSMFSTLKGMNAHNLELLREIILDLTTP